MERTFVCTVFDPLQYRQRSGQNTWQLPQSGWLYVLDADTSGNDGHVLLVDPSKDGVRGSITVGMAPEFTISPDGSTMFVVSGPADQGRISMYDARTGQFIAGTDIQNRIQYTSWPESSTVAVSRDGHWLFVETMRIIASDIDEVDEYEVLRFAVGKNSIAAAGRALLPECGIADLVPLSGDWDLLVHCPLSNATRRILFDTDGGVPKYADLEMPTRPFDPTYGQMEHAPMSAQAVMYQGTSDDILVLTGWNELCRLNFSEKTGPCASFPRLRGRWIPQRPWPYSADGRFLYFGSGPVSNRFQGTANSIEVADTETMTLVSSIDVSTPFRTLAIDPRGKKLYAASPDSHKIVQIDATTKKEIKEIVLADFRPAVVVPVP